MSETRIITINDKSYELLNSVIQMSATLVNLSEDVPEGPIPLPSDTVNPHLFARIILPWCLDHIGIDVPTEGRITSLTEAEIALFSYFDERPREIFTCIEIANYLEMKALINQLAFQVASYINGRNPQEMRAFFGIEAEESRG